MEPSPADADGRTWTVNGLTVRPRKSLCDADVTVWRVEWPDGNYGETIEPETLLDWIADR